MWIKKIFNLALECPSRFNIKSRRAKNHNYRRKEIVKNAEDLKIRLAKLNQSGAKATRFIELTEGPTQIVLRYQQDGEDYAAIIKVDLLDVQT